MKTFVYKGLLKLDDFRNLVNYKILLEDGDDIISEYNGKELWILVSSGSDGCYVSMILSDLNTLLEITKKVIDNFKIKFYEIDENEKQYSIVETMEKYGFGYINEVDKRKEKLESIKIRLDYEKFYKERNLIK